MINFERIDVHSDSNITLQGVECEAIVDAEIVCETKRGKISFHRCKQLSFEEFNF